LSTVLRAHLAQDFAIAALAAPQYGIVTHPQLSAAGIGRSAIVRRVAAGRLHPVHRGVYAVGHTALAPEARWRAAVLACGEGALLSHHSAAAPWGVHDQDPALPHVSIPTRNGRSRPGIVVHRSELDEADRSDHKGIPVTTPERTLSDVARGATEEALTRWVREAEFRDLLDEDRMGEVLDRRPSRVLALVYDDVTPTQSRMEDRMLRLCSRHRLPRPLTQQWLFGGRVDFLWSERRVVAEVDSWAGHRGRVMFQKDRTETNVLQLAGYVVLRFTWTDVTRRPTSVARMLRAALR
jgi:very-short-patch-repair endonuclease/predicted transcriptional regulator of viral defense system